MSTHFACHRRPRAVASLLGLLLALVKVPMARAEAPARSAERPADPGEHRRWYGLQTMASDLVALGFLFGAAKTFRFCWNGSCDNSTSAVLFAASAGTYGLVPPLIHGAHGEWGKAGLSFGLRATPILAGAALAQVDGGSAGALIAGGTLAVMIIDSAVLAYEPLQTAPIAVSPVVDPHTRTAMLLVSGAY